ncbi:transposase [Streptomyces xanthophaeus]|uniref:transposase n=1 Tax=Streptomyces xanthophaeus TaxID=67385 RepID=UPI003693D196
MRRHERSDAEWQLVQPLLPRSVLGLPRLDDRTILNGIVWRFRTGVAWRDVPDRYGSGPVSTPVSAGGRRTEPSSGCSRPRRRERTR